MSMSGKAGNLVQMFNSPTCDNYLHAVYLLTQIYPGHYTHSFFDYKLRLAEKDSWYKKFLQEKTREEEDNVYSSDPVVMLVTKHYMLDAIALTLLTDQLARENAMLTEEKYKAYAKKFVATDIKITRAQVTHVQEIAQRWLADIQTACLQYPQDSELRKVMKLPSVKNSLPKFERGDDFSTAPVSLMILPLFERNYDEEIKADKAAAEAAEGTLRPTSTSMSGLQLRLRLA